MNESELLPSLAEIAVALLGFAAIVSAFQARSESWTPDGRYWLMLQFGLATLAFALLPLPLLAAGATQSVTWASSSALFTVFGASAPVLVVRSFRRDRAAGRPANLAAFLLVVGGSSSSAILLAYNALALHDFWPYLAALVWFAVITAFMFLRTLQVWLGP